MKTITHIKYPPENQTSRVSSSDSSVVSDFEVEVEAYPLHNQRGEIYHTIPAEKCRIGIVSRRCISGVPGRESPITEAAFVRSNGAWLPPLFIETCDGSLKN